MIRTINIKAIIFTTLCSNYKLIKEHKEKTKYPNNNNRKHFKRKNNGWIEEIKIPQIKQKINNTKKNKKQNTIKMERKGKTKIKKNVLNDLVNCMY